MRREITRIVVLSLIAAAIASAAWAGRAGSGESGRGWSEFAWSGGGWSANNWFGMGRYSRNVDRSFDITPDTRLEIRSASFDVSLARGSGTTLHVHGTVRGSNRAVVDGARVTLQQSDGQRVLAIELPGSGFMHFLDAHVTIDVPAVAAVAVVGTSGDIGATDLRAPLNVQTSSGDVTVERAAAAVAIRTSSGDVIVRHAAGALRAETISGDVEASDIGGSLSSMSTSGDLSVTLASRWSGSSLAMHTSSGDIELTVPSGFRGALHASTSSGDVSNDARLLTTANDGVPIDLTSSSGDITVR